ncbi:MAG: cell division protein FtsA [Chloroflexota bacterium]|nr:cell division protein FtsA [Chloroflexota bacterium]
MLGVGICPSQGLKKGVVVDVQSAVEAIATALHRAEQQSGFKATNAFVGIAGSHILSTNSHAIVAIRHPDDVVSDEDVARVIDGARVIPLPADQEILHVVPHHFVVDGNDGIKDAVGMVGRRLEVEANIVTGSITSIHNLRRCIEQVGVELDDLVLEPLAAGRSVLTESEREFGVLVIDMGGGTTDAAVFNDGSVVHACVLPVGGNQISNDLAFGMRTTFPAAEEIKIRYGCTIDRVGQHDEPITLPGYGREGGQCVDRHTIAEIIDARLSETFELLQDQVAQAGYADAYPSGIVLTGGSAQIAGAVTLAGEIFRVPARLGAPRSLTGLADAVRGPAFATSVGLLSWGGDQLGPAAHEHAGGGVGRIGSSLITWLRNFFG